MDFNPVGKELLGDVDGSQLGISIDGWGVTEGACENRDGVGDTVVWIDGGLSEV